MNEQRGEAKQKESAFKQNKKHAATRENGEGARALEWGKRAR